MYQMSRNKQSDPAAISLTSPPTPELNRSIHRPDDGALSVRLRCSALTFPPVWNVTTETLADGDRTKYLATWNKAFAILVGHSHPSVLVAVEAFQVDLALAEQMIDLDALGQLPVKTVKRSTHRCSCRGVCAHSARIAVTVASPWPRLCEALVTAFASNTKARLDHFGL